MIEEMEVGKERTYIGPSNTTIVSFFALGLQSATSHVCFKRSCLGHIWTSLLLCPTIYNQKAILKIKNSKISAFKDFQ
jgi:hypothetical protein